MVALFFSAYLYQVVQRLLALTGIQCKSIGEAMPAHLGTKLTHSDCLRLAGFTQKNTFYPKTGVNFGDGVLR